MGAQAKIVHKRQGAKGNKAGREKEFQSTISNAPLQCAAHCICTCLSSAFCFMIH